MAQLAVILDNPNVVANFTTATGVPANFGLHYKHLGDQSCAPAVVAMTLWLQTDTALAKGHASRLVSHRTAQRLDIFRLKSLLPLMRFEIDCLAFPH